MSLIYIGDASYKDIAVPVPGKNDWGVDTMTRIVLGARNGLVAFINTLAQGQAAPAPWAAFKLQTWSPDDSDPIWGKVTLGYKGILGAHPPDQKYNEVIESSGSSSAQFDPPYPWGGDEDAVAAVMDFTYYAGQTTWRSLRTIDNGPQYGYLGFTYGYVLKRVRYTVTGDGGSQTTFGNSAPVGIVSACTPAFQINTVGYRASPIFGTPYFECEDIVRGELVGR